MIGYAIYRQTQRHEVIGSSRFKLAIIYAVVGLAVGGFSRPDTAAEWVGTYAYFAHISDDGGFGEVLIMIAVMVAFQAELIWRRARALGARTASRPAALARQQSTGSPPAGRPIETERCRSPWRSRTILWAWRM